MDQSLNNARDLVLTYREFIQSQQVDLILDALSEDATLQVPDAPLLSGKSAIRQFYENRFAVGEYRFQLDITDEKAVSDLYFINGSMTRTISRQGVQDTPTVMNFSFILKKEAGNLKIWQMRVV